MAGDELVCGVESLIAPSVVSVTVSVASVSDFRSPQAVSATPSVSPRLMSRLQRGAAHGALQNGHTVVRSNTCRSQEGQGRMPQRWHPAPVPSTTVADPRARSRRG